MSGNHRETTVSVLRKDSQSIRSRISRYSRYILRISSLYYRSHSDHRESGSSPSASLRHPEIGQCSKRLRALFALAFWRLEAQEAQTQKNPKKLQDWSHRPNEFIIRTFWARITLSGLHRCEWTCSGFWNFQPRFARRFPVSDIWGMAMWHMWAVQTAVSREVE